MNIETIYHDYIPDFMQEAINSKAMQRLKKVGMNCGCEYTSFEPFVNIGPYSRFDHSVGVGLIVYHFTKDPKQALAGLFHDISTPCFAHVIDFLNGDHVHQQSTEEQTKEMIEKDPTIQTLLKKMGLTTDDVCDYHIYPIADNDTPLLSADRLEYTLGNIVNYGFGSKEDIEMIYRNLTVVKNENGVDELAFKDVKIAKRFTELMVRCASIYECDADRCMMEYLALLLKGAIEEGVISRDDLNKTEDVVIDKLMSNDKYLQKWNQFRAYKEIKTSPVPQDGYMKILAKKRYINPLVCDLGRMMDVDEEMKKLISDFVKKGFDYYIKAI